jgi:hypothetical protein
MKRLLALVSLVALAAAHAGPSVLESVEIVPSKKESFSSPTLIKFQAKSADIVSVDLELGDSLNDLILRLHPQSGVRGEFVVEQSFETSLTVMQEGPHLDLVEWKHHTSPWVPLKKLSATDFRIPTISEADSQKFPEVTPKEIRAIVAKEGGAKLGEYVSKVKGPNDYPCGIGLSKVSFRIILKEGGEARVVKTLEFLVPMGC